MSAHSDELEAADSHDPITLAAFPVEPVNADTVMALVRRELGDPRLDVALIQETSMIRAHATYVEIAEIWKRLKAEIDRRRAYFAPRKVRARVVWQDWLAAEHEAIDALEGLATKGARLLGAYDAEQRRIADETRRGLEATARLAAEADQFVAALDAAADGAPDVAADILAEPPMMTVASVPSATPLVKGVSTTGKWKAELVVPGQIDKLILEAADEIRTRRPRVAASLLKVDQMAMNQLATSMKGGLARVAGRLGLRVYEARILIRTNREETTF